MVDRQTIYAGQVPLETDLLNAQRDGMVGLGMMAQTVLGTPTLVDNFTVTPTTPASLSVVLTAGNIYQLENLEATTWSSLAADIGHSIVKQGIQLDPVTFGITPPNTFGYSQVFLVEVQYQDLDSGSTVLPYYNAANPTIPFSGPGNAGTAQNTVRKGIVASQVKAGVAAPTGSQVTPTQDAGWIGLYTITVANGASTITAGNIAVYPNAPFLATNGHLPQIPTGVQFGTWVYATDLSAGGAAPATSASTATSSAILTFASVPSWVAVGMRAFDLTTPGAITGSQTVQSVTATTVTLTANVNATVNSGDQIAFSNNAMVATVAPAPASLAPGLRVSIKSAGTNSGAVTLNLNGLGAVAVHRANGANLSPGDITASMVVDLVYDGSSFQMSNFEGFTSTTTNNNTSIISIPYGTDTGAANALVASFTPAVTGYAAGLTIEVKVAHPNTGATTINCNGLGTQNIVDSMLQPLVANMLVAGEVALLIHDGTQFQLANRANTQTNAFTLYVNGATGSDSNDGLAATSGGGHGPVQTIQKAFNLAGQYPPGPNAITINVASWASSYLGGSTPNYLCPPLILNGAGSSSTTIDNSPTTGGPTIHCQAGNTLTVQNATFKATTGTFSEEQIPINPFGLLADNSTIIIGTGVVMGQTAGAQIGAFSHGIVDVQNGYTISGNAGSCLYCEDQGFIYISPITITISTAITVTFFFGADDMSVIQCNNLGSLFFVNASNVTGQKYNISDTSLMETGLASASIPGTTAGFLGSYSSGP